MPTTEEHAGKKASTKADKAAELSALAQAASMRGWDEWIETLQVPPELVAALGTGRPELMPLPRAMTAEEVKILLDIIAGCIRTNQALQAHAQRTAQLADNLCGQLDGSVRLARQLGHFAAFRHEYI